MNIYNLIIAAEKCILFFIALLTIFSVGAEMYAVIQIGKITLPIFIAITALCRLIILQGKGISTVDLIYEGCAVLLLAISTLIIQYGSRLSKNNNEQDM